MADVNYFSEGNPGIPGFRVPAGLAGALYGQDRARYEQRAGLQDILMAEKARDFMRDAPVRESARYKDINTNRAIGDTVGGMKAGELEKLQLENRFNKGTLDSRMAEAITKASKAQHDFGMQKIQDGMALASTMMNAMGSYGPAGAAQVVQQMKQRGIDVENDPVVRYVMSTSDPREMQQRISQIHNAFNMANQGYRTEDMKGQYGLAEALIRGNSAYASASVRGAQEKEHDESINAYAAELKEEHPDWSPAKIRAEAVRRYQQGKYGIGGRLETSEDKNIAKRIAELEEIIPLLREDSPVRARLQKQYDELQAKKRAVGVPQNDGKPRGQPGTADNPIKLK